MPSYTRTISKLKESIKGMLSVTKTIYYLIAHSEISINSSKFQHIDPPTDYVSLSRRLRQRERLHATGVSICSSVCLSVFCYFVCRQIAKTRFSQKLSKLKLWCLLTIYRKHMGFSKNPLFGPLKSKMLRSAIFKIDMTSFFFCWGWSDLDKISQTGAAWHVDCGDGQNRNQM